MRQIKKLRSLSRVERRVLAQAAFWLPTTSVLLRILGFKRTLAYFERGMSAVADQSIASEEIETARNVVRLINVAATHGLFRARCLQKSLVLVKFLNAQGMPSELKLGARMQGEEFGAHAWVECGGVVINDGEDVECRYPAFRSPAGQRSDEIENAQTGE
jgi:hypothetical protein